MATIEPELVSAEVPKLKQRYKHETKAEAKARALRYAKAFKEYDRQLQLFMEDLNEKTRAYAHAAAKSIEAMHREGELSDLADLESAIATEPSSDSSHA